MLAATGLHLRSVGLHVQEAIDRDPLARVPRWHELVKEQVQSIAWANYSQQALRAAAGFWVRLRRGF
jgi:hypothetical protein